MMTREEFIAAVDWGAVAAGVAEHRAGLEHAIAQRNAEIRAAARHPRLRDQEQLAAWQENIAACDELLAVIEG